MEFGHRLKELREDHDLGQKEIASLLNVSVSAASSYERGRNHPDFKGLCALADYFGVSTDYLLGRTKCPYNIDILNKQLTKDYSVSDLINTSIELSPSEISELQRYIDYLKKR
jgi:transcriptional regulator with XRE-family HTH domain